MLHRIKKFFNTLINQKEKYVIIFTDSTPITPEDDPTPLSIKADNLEKCIKSKLKCESYKDEITGDVTVLLDPFMMSLEDVVILLNLEFDNCNIYLDKDLLVIVDLNRDNKIIKSTVEKHKELKFSYRFEYKNVLLERLMSRLWN